MGKSLTGKELGVGISEISSRPGVYVGRFVDKHTKKRYVYYGRDLNALRRKLEKARYEAENGVYGNGANVTLEEWFEEFLNLYKLNRVRDVTVYRIKQSFKPCQEHSIGQKKLNEIKGVDIQSFINELIDNGFAISTLKILIGLLKEMYKTAIGNALATVNPCNAVILPKEKQKEPKYLTEKEQEMFLEIAKGYAHYEIFLFNLSTGLRIGEVLGLKWSDIDFEKKTISIERTLHYNRLNDNDVCHFFFTEPKTELSKRTIPLLPEAEKVLKIVRKKQLRNKALYATKWKQEEPFEDMIFTTEQQGRPIRYGDVNRSIKTIVAKANVAEEEMAKLENREPFILKEFSPHCFRHTFVTRCKAQDISYEDIRLYVGHSREEMTMYYDHNKPEINVDSLTKISFLNMV